MSFLFFFVLGCFGWQIYVHFWYFKRIFKPTLSLPAGSDLPAVTILVSARNEERNIPALLKCLAEQTYPKDKFEVILVDDRSTDNTQQEAFAHGGNILNFMVLPVTDVPEGINPKKNALQMGIAQSKFDWLLLTDADCRVGKNWIESMMRSRKDIYTKIVLGVAPLTRYKFNNLLEAFTQYETFYTALQYVGFAQGGKPYMGVGRNLLYHKSLFEEVGGFGRFLYTTGGDDDLFINQVANAKNTAVGLNADFVYSDAPKTWSAWYKQKLRHLSVGKYYNRQAQMRLALLYASQGGIWLGTLMAFLYLPALPAWGIITLFLLRSGIVWQDYSRLAGKLGCSIGKGWIPIFDGLFVPYLFFVGGLAYFTKNIKWKN